MFGSVCIYLIMRGVIPRFTFELMIDPSETDPVFFSKVPGMSLGATLSHSFDVSKFGSGGEHIYSPVQSVLHNMVHLDFKLCVTPKDSRADCSDYLGAYLWYVDGPKKEFLLNYDLCVAVNGRLITVAHQNGYRIKCDGSGIGSGHFLPRAVEDLARRGYLCQNNTQLHIVAHLNIPLSAFEDTSKSFYAARSYRTLQQAGHIDSFRLSLFKQLKTPVAIESAKSERIVIKGKRCTWWAHKTILSHVSEVFAGWFDPGKPVQALNNSLKNGRLDLTDLSDDVIQHMLYFIYMGTAGQGFDELALEIVEPAERFKIEFLKETCQQSLMQEVDKMSVDDLFANLVQADKFDLAQLKSSAAAKLCQSTEAIDLEPAKFLKMLSDVRRLKLVELNEWCVKWMKKNYLKFNQIQLKQLMENNDKDGQAVMGYLIQTLCTE